MSNYIISFKDNFNQTFSYVIEAASFDDAKRKFKATYGYNRMPKGTNIVRGTA